MKMGEGIRDADEQRLILTGGCKRERGREREEEKDTQIEK